MMSKEKEKNNPEQMSEADLQTTKRKKKKETYFSFFFPNRGESKKQKQCSIHFYIFI